MSGVQGYLDKAKPYLSPIPGLFKGALQSNIGEKLAENWSQDKINPNSWALLKGIGIAVTGKYYFGAAFTRHLASGLWEGAKATKNMWENYKALKGMEEFDSKTFAKNEFSNFNAAIADLKQAGKDLAGFYLFSLNQIQLTNPFDIAPFGILGHIPLGIATGNIATTILNWSPFGLLGPSPLGIPLGTIGTALAVGYFAYAPQSISGQLNRFEAWWRPENVKPITDREVETLSVGGAVQHLTDGSYSLSRLFNMHEKVEEAPEVEKRRSRKLDRETASDAAVSSDGVRQRGVVEEKDDDTSISGEEKIELTLAEDIKRKWSGFLDSNGDPKGMSTLQLMEFRGDLARVQRVLEGSSPKKKSE